jgi:hypothetical protein
MELQSLQLNNTRNWGISPYFSYVCEEIIEQDDKMLARRPLARVYALYLKEQCYKFNIEWYISLIKTYFQNPWKFCELYFDITPKRRNLLCKPYLHNYVLQQILRSPNPYVGSVQIWSFKSGLQNETMRFTTTK